MDLGLMTKKLKTLQYKSKAEFVHDLNLIWANCIRYNDKPGHFLAKNAQAMQQMSQRLIPLIPDIIIRSREEVDAEERRQAAAEAAEEGADESDDEPIIQSRGRKATSKKARKGAAAPQVADSEDGTPAAESKNGILNGVPGLRKDFVRADSDTAMEGIQTGGLNTPPPGTLTPGGAVGAGAGSQGDMTELDNLNDGALAQPEIDYDDHDYKIWKQVTKKDRATMASDRHRLFKDDKLNPEEPALMRTRAGMRRWLRKREDDPTLSSKRKGENIEKAEAEQSSETLAQGLEENEETVLPGKFAASDPVLCR